MKPAPMPAAEARALLARLGWTQKEAADRLGVTKRAVEKWLAPQSAIPRPWAHTLRLIAERERIGT